MNDDVNDNDDDDDDDGDVEHDTEWWVDTTQPLPSMTFAIGWG